MQAFISNIQTLEAEQGFVQAQLNIPAVIHRAIPNQEVLPISVI